MMNQGLVNRRQEQALSPALPASAAARCRSEAPLDNAVLDGLRSLQRPGQPNFLRRLADSYLTSAGDSLRALRDAVNRSDVQSVYSIAHKLKSSSASIGARALAATFAKLELMGSNGAIGGAGEILCMLDVEFEAVSQALRSENLE